MALTRSSFKCCISNLSVNIEDSATINDKIITLLLWTSWSSKYGASFLPDGTVLDGSTNLTKGQLKKRQDEFFIEQFDTTAASIVSSSLNQEEHVSTKMLRYLKVLVCWALKFNAKLCIEKLHEQVKNYEDILADGAVPLLDNAENIMQSILVLIFNSSSLSEIILSIDEISVSPRQASDVSIWQYSILSNGVISSTQDGY
jgi:hypothetical protein